MDAQEPRPHYNVASAVEVDFGVGDYVLVARRGNKGHSKVRPQWLGPARVVSAVNDRVFTVLDLVTNETQEVHATHLRRYADKQLHVTKQLRDFVAAGGRGHVIDSIVDYRLTNGTAELLLLWEGETVSDATWEPIVQIFHDAPVVVRRYIKLVQDEDERAALHEIVTRL